MFELTANLVLQKTKQSELRHVKKLNVCGVQLNNIEILHDTPNLEVVSLSVNSIEGLEPLGSCSHLQEVYMRKNFIKDIREVLYLHDLKHLRTVGLSDNPISQSAQYRKYVIAAIPALEKLDDVDVSPEERHDAERMFPDILSDAPPPPERKVESTPPPSARAPPSTSRVHDEEAVGRGGAVAQPTRVKCVAAPRASPRTSPQTRSPQSRNRSPQAVHVANRAPPASRALPTSRPTAPVSTSRLREETVVRAINAMLCELSPAGLLAVRQHLESLL